MGFGKWVLGGVCAAGAVIAAPIVVPAAGMAIAGSAATGMVGLSLGLGMATASSATIATTAGVAAGVAGVAAGAAQEKKIDNARVEGKQEGYKKASYEYEVKFCNQADDFLNNKKNWENDRDEYERLLKEYGEYIKELEKELGYDNEKFECMVKQYNALYALGQRS